MLDHGHTGNGADHGPVHQSRGGLIVTGAGDIARLEHILQAVQGTAVDHLLHGAAVGLQNGHGEVVAAQGAGPDDADHQQDEQGGHTHGTDLLNAVADAAHNDDQGDEHEDQTIDHGLALVGQQAAEHLCAAQAAGAEAGVEEAAQVHGDILDAVAAQSAVERQDQEGCDDTQPAQPLEALGEDLIGADDAAAGLAAQGQLAHHDDEAAQRRQDQIDDQEREAAVGAHLVGEAPDVAKAHRRSHGSHQEPECGSKAFSFFHCFLSFFFFRPAGAGVGARLTGGVRLLGIFKVYRDSVNCTIDNFNKLLTAISANLTLCELIHILFLCIFCILSGYLPETYLPTRSIFFH